MTRKMMYNFKCPYCDKSCDTKKDEYSITKRKTKQYFHKACYEKNIIKNR